MELLPRIAPAWVAGGAVQMYADTGALWLMVMGAVMMAIGGAYLVRMAWATLPWEKYQAAMQKLMDAEHQAKSPDTAMAAKATARLRN